MSTAVRRPAAARAAKMTPELITPSALVRPCMNGARRRKNASARRGINTLAPAATLAAVTAIAVMGNIRNANVKPDSRGVPLAECVSAMVPTGARSTKTAPAWDINSKAVRASSSNAPLIPIMPFAISANAKRLLVYSPDGAAVTLSFQREGM